MPALRSERLCLLFVDIGSRRLDDLRLPLALAALGRGEVGKRAIGLDAIESRVERGARDAELLCFGPK